MDVHDVGKSGVRSTCQRAYQSFYHFKSEIVETWPYNQRLEKKFGQAEVKFRTLSMNVKIRSGGKSRGSN